MMFLKGSYKQWPQEKTCKTRIELPFWGYFRMFQSFLLPCTVDVILTSNTNNLQTIIGKRGGGQ